MTSGYATGRCSLTTFLARADARGEVAESDETNNTSSLTVPLIC